MRKLDTGLRAVLLLVTVLVAAVITSATVARDSATGNFSANMQMGAGAKSSMNFDGQLAWAKPNLRLDLKDKLTKESMVVLVDFSGGDATLLYPDTLNGFRTKLPAVDTSGYIRQFESLLANGGSKVEPGWKKEKVASEMIGKTAADKYKLTGPQGEVVHWWIDGQQRPLRLSTGRGDNRVTLNFGELTFGAKVPAEKFTVGKQFTVLDFKGDPRTLKQK